MPRIILFFACIVFCFGRVSAQSDSLEVNRYNHIRVSGSSSYSFLYEESYPSFSISYVRLINPLKVLSVGMRYEQITRDNLHHSFFIPVEFRPFAGIKFLVLPGFSMNEEQPFAYTTKLEAAYHLQFGRIEFGPSVSLTLNKVENFAAGGLMVGFLF